MNRDFKIALVPGAKEGELQIILYSTGYPETGKPIDASRVHFTPQIEEIEPPPPKLVDIDATILGELRGEEGKRKVESAIMLVSDWLLGTDVSIALDTLIGTLPDKSQVRIIFSADKRLRTKFDLAKVPVELIRPKGVDTPFAINPKVASILHLLDEVGVGQNAASSLDWPLRVLIVRSNPTDLGLAVPEATPLRNKILELGDRLGAGAVTVNVISSEAAVGKPATWDEFTKQLNDSQDPYDIVIYLGHGSLKEEGGESVGCLQFEVSGGHKDIPAYDIIVPFQNKPVPVVLLIACQTSDQVEDKFKGLHAQNMPQWIRGSQGVAQALINSLQSGTQLVVGMRYKLETEDAVRFLESFFDSLLRNTPGDVEAAVHLARRELKTKSRFPAAFSAPVIFRRLRRPDLDEPLFQFIGKKKYVPTTCQGPEGDWTAREIFWDDLKQLSWAQRSDDSKQWAQRMLKLSEDRLIQNAVVGKTALVLPESVLGLPGQKKTLAVKLHGSLGEPNLTQLKAQLLFDRDDIILEKTQTSAELKAAGYKVLAESGTRQVDFSIEPVADPKLLQNLTLFEVTLQMGPSFNHWSHVRISGIQTTPQKVVCPGINAIIVPPP